MLTEAERKARKKAGGQAYYAANREKVKAAAKAWAGANPEKVRSTAKAWLQANPGRRQAIAAAWYEANKEQVIAAAVARDMANPDGKRARVSKRRARKRGAGGSHSGADRLAILERQKWCCAEPGCKTDLRKDRGNYPSGRKKHRYHIDHIVPIALGGTDNRHNLQALCPSCNYSKGAKHPLAFAQELGRLL